MNTGHEGSKDQENKMEQEKLKHFKSLFNNILLAQGFASGGDDDFEKHRAPKGDELDLAARDRDQELDLKLKGRKSFFVKKIENSLKKIDEGTFGTCEECGADISLKRLMARPTATMCISCKEEQESCEKHIPYEKKSHTLGQELNNSSNVIHIQFGEDGNNGKPMKKKGLPH